MSVSTQVGIASDLYTTLMAKEIAIPNDLNIAIDISVCCAE